MTTLDSFDRCARRTRFQSPVAFVACAFFAATVLLSAQAFAKPAGKVEICHIPPGNPANAHTIKVSGNAIKAHLKHGDYLGPCGPSCQDTCDDNNACTTDECFEGECTHSPVDCNDGNQCTVDSCDPETGGCETVPLPGESCTDQDGSACTLDTGFCNEAGDCELTAIPECCETDAECADPDLCTFEQCTDNQCEPAGGVVCTPSDVCQESGCDAETGECVELPVVCDPPGPCETGGFCDPVGGCVYAPIPGCCLGDDACDDGDPCSSDACFNYECVHETCHDPVSPCDQYETCDDQCVPIITGPTNCNDGDICTDNDCDPGAGGCLNPPLDCTDEDACTMGEYCDPDLGCASSPVDCDDGDPCTIDNCDSDLGCAPVPKCDDDAGEICNPITGACEVELICNFSAPDSNSRLFFMDGYNLLGVNPLDLPFNGSAKIICDTYTPDGTAQRVCSAEFVSVDPMFIPIIGDICLVPMPAEDCSAGLIDCQPGNDLDIDLVMNHTIPMPGGTCTDNQACRDECDSHCASLGATRFDNSPACEGFCRLADTPMCTHDDDPPDANSCPAGDTCDEVNHGNTCSCQCQSLGNGSPVGAGQARLEIGYGIDINFINPSTGFVEGRGPDLLPCTADDEPQGTLPPTCFPFTTTTATTSIENANNVGGGLITPLPASNTGAPFMCTSGVVLSTSGAELQGVGDFIDTRLYDFAATLTVNCE